VWRAVGLVKTRDDDDDDDDVRRGISRLVAASSRNEPASPAGRPAAV